MTRPDGSEGVYASGALIANRYVVVQGPLEDSKLHGGMGSVYLCADRAEDGWPVALKTFHRSFLSNRNVRDRFLRESDIWVQLGRHRHIVRAHRVVRVCRVPRNSEQFLS